MLIGQVSRRGESNDHHGIIPIVIGDEKCRRIALHPDRTLVRVNLDDQAVSIVKQTCEELPPDKECGGAIRWPLFRIGHGQSQFTCRFGRIHYPTSWIGKT